MRRIRSQAPIEAELHPFRVVGLSMVASLAACFAAYLLVRLIALCTNLAYFGRLSAAPASPGDNHLGLLAVFVPVIGGLVVGVMARLGSSAIRGHGIPEAMERILAHESRIPKRLTVLKPLSSAIAIGTGGPFGAEGPIIATGGALGSMLGQIVHVDARTRKTLLAAGAAAGMTAIFGSPIAAVLLVVELLLFEFSAVTFVPVAVAAALAGVLRVAWMGSAPVFGMPVVGDPSLGANLGYVAIGTIVGLVAVGVTRAVYRVEDLFDLLPIHWMWWPAVGGGVVGLVGLVAPRSLGVGYVNIDDSLTGVLAGRALAVLCVWKFLSWVVALASGTSGGTLAPLLTLGAGLGSSLGWLTSLLVPQVGIDPRLAALVGMAAMFTGASRALLASIVFAFETTHQTSGLLPLLGGCTAAFLVASSITEDTIMTMKIERRGTRVPRHMFPRPDTPAPIRSDG